MFKYQNKEYGFLFSLEVEGSQVEYTEWEKYEEEFITQISILNALIDNGYADATEEGCLVGFENIYELDSIDLEVLEIPDFYPFELYIQANGQLNEESFLLEYNFCDFAPNGTYFTVDRNKNIIKYDNYQYLLTKSQFLLCEAIEEFNALSSSDKTFQNNLLKFSEIKELSLQSSTILDSYLMAENVFHPDKIKIDLSYDQNDLILTPNTGFENDDKFLKTFNIYPSVKDVYPTTNLKGERVRVTFNEKQKTDLTKIKKEGFNRIKDKEIQEKILANPECFFDADVIDLDYFSDRVIEVGAYKPKFYPFVCPYKSEWIPGFTVKDNVNGTKKIVIQNEEKLEEFKVVKKQAEDKGEQTFEWEEHPINISDANSFIKVAEKQFQLKNKPVDNDVEQIVENKVLIIQENAEYLNYDAHTTPIKADHIFHEISNLNSKIQLKEHQKEGVSWLQSLYKQKVKGCLLADDMGLGKTLQVLYFIEWVQSISNTNKPYLIVAPVSLLENWKNEYEKFFHPQSLPIITLSGSSYLTKEFNKEVVNELNQKQIILTNYETVRRYQFNMCAVDYSLVILDEAQRIKTPGTLITNATKALKADFKIAMTGTPVENSLVDFWCLMDFSMPGLLGSAKDFAKLYEKPLQESETDLQALGNDLRSNVGDFLKRRLKIDVAKDLPEKHLVYCEKQMPAKQLERYQLEIEIAQGQNLQGVEYRNQVLKSLQAVRNISDHPYLLENNITSYTPEELVQTSAKLQVLVDVISQVEHKQEKVIVFADRRETQKMLQWVIQGYFSLSPSIINGDTPSTKKKQRKKSKLSRQQTIDKFQAQKGFNVIIMSQLAAGVGLNVTGANHVIHFSRHWNPAKEEQATDRAYRIGQTKDVYVYYPMAVSEFFKSFDLVLEDLLNRKKTLASNTLYPTERVEVKPDDLFQGAFNIDVSTNYKPYTIEDIDHMQGVFFEKFTAAFYQKLGYNILLTPASNDKGVDVLAFSEQQNLLIQCKRSNSPINIKAIQEVVGAKAYYTTQYGKSFDLVLFTNNILNANAIEQAQLNHVIQMTRSEIIQKLDELQITQQDIIKL